MASTVLGASEPVAATFYDYGGASYNAKHPEFNCKADGITDDTAGVLALCNKLTSGDTITFPGGTYLVSIPDGTTFKTFTGLSNIRIIAHGAIFKTSQGSYTLATIAFEFVACVNVRLDGFNGETWTNPTLSTRASVGLGWFVLKQGCKGFTAPHIKLTGGRYGATVTRLITDPESYKSSNIDIGLLETTGVGYPFNCQHSGDNVRAVIRASGATRTYFIYGCSDHEVDVYSTANYAADCLVSALDGATTSDIKVRYRNTGTATADLSGPSVTAVQVNFKYGPTVLAPATLRNIDITADLDVAVGGLGLGLDVYKYNASDVADTVDRGHILDGLTFKLTAKNLNTSFIPLNYGSGGTFGAGDFHRNLRFEDTSVTGACGDSLVNLGSLDAHCTLDQVVLPGNCFITNAPATAKVLVRNASAKNFTSATTDAGPVRYENVKVTDGTTQSRKNKRFVNSSIAGIGSQNLAPVAWVTFTPGATPTILSSCGVASVVQTAGGNYRVTFLDTFPSMNAMCPILTVGDAAFTCGAFVWSTTQVDCKSYNAAGTLTDVARMQLVLYVNEG